MAVEATVG
jgi:mannose-6-phosphate isomerase-like protein (cupin superfamily)